MVDNPLYQRAMFTGAPQAAPQPSVGTGITSGLVDQPVLNVTQQGGFTPASMPQGGPADAEQGQMAMMSATGLESMASGLQEMFDEIDDAEDVETMINTVRGDKKSIAARYEELAELVGEADAKKTPESVLAVLQPTFQIMESLSGDMPEGGLASLMASEEPEATVRSPGAEEAAMRMLGGEQPVRRFHGSPHTGESILNRRFLGQADTAASPLQSPYIRPVGEGFTPAMALQAASERDAISAGPMSLPVDRPVFSSELERLKSIDTGFNKDLPFTSTLPPAGNELDIDEIKKATEQYRDLFAEGLPEADSLDAIARERMDLLKPYMPPQRTKEQIMQDTQDFLGGDAQKDMETQALLALARAGAVVGSTPGSLLQALTAGGGQLATDLSPIIAQKTELDRDLKKFALQTETEERNNALEAGRQVMFSAIQREAEQSDNLDRMLFSAQADAIAKGFDTGKFNAKVLNDSQLAAYQANLTLSGRPVLNYRAPIGPNGKYVPIQMQNTDKGLFMITNEGFKPMPEGAIPVSDEKWSDYATVLGGAGAMADAQKTEFLELDPNTGTYVPRAGFFLPDNGVGGTGGYWITETGSMEDARRPRKDFIAAKNLAEVLDQKTDEVGRTYMTNKLTGKTYMTDFQGIPTGALRYQVEGPVRDQTTGLIISGNPRAIQRQEVGIPIATMPTTMLNRLKTDILYTTQLLDEVEQLMGLAGEATGPIASVQAFAGNSLASLLPDGVRQNFTETLNTEQVILARDLSERIVRNLQQSEALSDRHAVAEQNIIRNLSPDLTKVFKNPEIALLELQEISRRSYNRLSQARSLLSYIPGQGIQKGESEVVPYFEIQVTPSGTKDSPFEYNQMNEDYLEVMTRSSPNQPPQITRTQYVKMTNAQYAASLKADPQADQAEVARAERIALRDPRGVRVMPYERPDGVPYAQ